MIIELSKCKVHLKDELTWWDEKEIEATIAGTAGMKTDKAGINVDMTVNPEALLRATLKTYEKVVEKIETEDKTASFSEQWVRTLNKEDGHKLEEAIEQITAKKK